MGKISNYPIHDDIAGTSEKANWLVPHDLSTGDDLNDIIEKPGVYYTSYHGTIVENTPVFNNTNRAFSLLNIGNPGQTTQILTQRQYGYTYLRTRINGVFTDWYQMLIDRGIGSQTTLKGILRPYTGIGIQYPSITTNGNHYFYTYAKVKNDDNNERGFACIITSPGSMSPGQRNGIYMVEAGIRRMIYSGIVDCIHKPGYSESAKFADLPTFGYYSDDEYTYFGIESGGYNNAFVVLPLRLYDLYNTVFLEPSAGTTTRPEGWTDMQIRYLMDEDQVRSIIQEEIAKSKT